MIGLLGIGRHSRLRDLLSAYIDGQVNEGEATRVEEHVSGCDECRRELDTLRMTVCLLHRLPEVATSRSFALTEAPEPIARGWSIAWPAPAAASVAGLLVAALLLGDAFGIVAQRSDQVVPDFSQQAPLMAAEAVPVTQAVSAEAVVEKEVVVEKAVVAERIVKEVEAPVAAMAAPAPEVAPAAPAAAPLAAASVPAPGDSARQEGPAAAPPPPKVVESPSTVDQSLDTPVPVAPPVPALDAPPLRPDQRLDSGLALPLWQLEVAAAVLFLALVLGTLWTVRRSRRPWG